MAHLPQNCVFRYLGFDDGVDMPLQCELLEFGENTLGAAWEQNIPAPPFNRLFRLVGGATGEIVMNRRTFPMRSGHLYLIPLQRPFRMRFFPPGAFEFMHFAARDAEGQDIFREVRTVQGMRTPRWLTLLAPLLANPLARPADALSLPAAYLAAIAEFTRLPDVEALWLHASVARPLQNVLALIRERNSATLRVSEIAATVGMSPAALSQAFRRAFGHSLKFHLTQDMLQRAMQLLTGTNKTVRQIASELGYCSASYFERTFRQVFRVSPLKYRAIMHPRGANRQLYGPVSRNERPRVRHLRHAIRDRR
jgi:AraC-like DNA-binding protein